MKKVFISSMVLVCLLSVIPSSAMKGTHNNISYYGNINAQRNQISAGISAENLWPSVSGWVKDSKGNTTSGTGTSYQSYSSMYLNSPGTTTIKDNQLTFIASSFRLTTKAD